MASLENSSTRQTAMVGDLPYPHPTSGLATAVMRANRKTGSSPEVRVRQELFRRGLRFRKNAPLRVGERLIRPDIVFGRHRIAVFIDGCFWHACPRHGNVPRSNTTYWAPKLARNVERDRRVDAVLRSAGWSPLRIWEHVPAGEAAELIIGVLAGPKNHPDHGLQVETQN